MKIGYIRVSTAEQNTARQEVLMEELGAERVYIDRMSGKIDALEKKLASVTSVTSMLEKGMGPEDIIGYILGEFEPEILEKDELSYRCSCSRDRMAKALISIGEKELQSLIDEKEPAELKCHFCGSSYTFSIEDLEGMLEAAKS